MRVNSMSRRCEVTAQVEALGVVAVIRLKDPARLRATVDAMSEGGVRALEVTMTVPRAVEMIRELAPSLPEGFLLGAGTVTDAETARQCAADVVKIFPANALGPQFIRDVRAPLPQIKVMPTGAVTLDNAGDWIRAGAVAVGVGSAL